MNFIDLSSEEVKKNSTGVVNGFYEYILGNPVEITTTRKEHKNDFLATNLCSDAKEDKLMIRYKPSNKIFISESLINSEDEENFASLYIDKKSGSCFVGLYEDFSMKSGVLVFSGFLSANNKVDTERRIYGNGRVVHTFMKRVMVISVGLRNDKLYALYYIPKSRGMAVGVDYSDTVAISTNTMRTKDCSSYVSFVIDDWFSGAKIKEI